MSSALSYLLMAWAIAAGLQLVLWLVSLRTRNAAIVDVGWAISFALVVLAMFLRTDAPLQAVLAPTLLVCAWSLRLTLYLIGRGAASGAEEGRYVDLRERWEPHATRSFFIFFQAQAALTGLLSIGFVWAFVAVPRANGLSTLLMIIGAGVAAVGIVGEALADAQLSRFKRDPANRGQVCDVGLWGYSRHPNYFFEITVWVGHLLYALAFPLGWLSAVAPTILAASIFKVTGIPATEAQALRTKGDAYRRYQAETNAFFPGPRRRSRSS